MSAIELIRRGYQLGSIERSAKIVPKDNRKEEGIDSPDAIYLRQLLEQWESGKPIHFVNNFESTSIVQQRNIENSAKLYADILNGKQCDELLEKEPYRSSLLPQFECLGSAFNEGDDQEIETIFFDAMSGQEIVAEDLWMKISWLSFIDSDDSLRFRFSFGVDFEEDVASDRLRQDYAARLTDAIFPESMLITENKTLLVILKSLLESEEIHYVERIIYFNAPNGGAYLHHDQERGHAGVVYAQLTGHTYWIACPQDQLVMEISQYILESDQSDTWPDSIDTEARLELKALATCLDKLADELRSFSNNALIHLINETKEFVQRLIEHGHSHQLSPGDILLLPQDSAKNCCWHSVFCLDESAGQALSYAIRA